MSTSENTKPVQGYETVDLDELFQQAKDAGIYTVAGLASAIEHFNTLETPLFGQAAYRFLDDVNEDTHVLTRAEDDSVIEITHDNFKAGLIASNAWVVWQDNVDPIICCEVDGETRELELTPKQYTRLALEILQVVGTGLVRYSSISKDNFPVKILVVFSARGVFIGAERLGLPS